jgi:hypothetical protein
VPQNTENILSIERLLTSVAQLQRVRRFMALCVVSVTTSGWFAIICLAMCLCVSHCGKEFKKKSETHSFFSIDGSKRSGSLLLYRRKKTFIPTVTHNSNRSLENQITFLLFCVLSTTRLNKHSWIIRNFRV